MSQHRAATRRVTPSNAARKPGASRPSAKHRVARRTTPGSTQIVGLTAALAAAAGAVGFSHSSLASPTQANSAVNIAALNLDKAQLSAVTTARIERRQLASRDASRLDVSLSQQKQAAADRTAKLRAAKLDTYKRRTMTRAAALLKAKQAELKRLQSETRAEMMLTGYRITARFGQGGTRWARTHTGVDFAAPVGTRIGAVMKGEVVFAGWNGPYGRQVRIRHYDGTVTSYSHMFMIAVSVGDTVYAGDKVGEVGMTGNTTGPHLHFEVMTDGETAINPLPWLRNHDLAP